MATSPSVLSSVKAKLDAMNNQVKKQSLVWRPTRGTEAQIRIVPYRHGADPFNELYFHYDVGAIKTILCPQTAGIGEPCPICNFAQSLLKEKSDKNFALWKRLKSRLRVYVPVLIRGAEAEGVKFWGIGKNTYQTIAQFFIEADYGDLSDPLKGRDLKVLATAPTPQYIYGQVRVLPAGKESKLSEDSQLAKNVILSCPSVFDAFQKMTEDEIKGALNSFIEQGDAVSENGVEEEATATDSVDTESLAEMFEKIKNQNNS